MGKFVMTLSWEVSYRRIYKTQDLLERHEFESRHKKGSLLLMSWKAVLQLQYTKSTDKNFTHEISGTSLQVCCTVIQKDRVTFQINMYCLIYKTFFTLGYITEVL